MNVNTELPPKESAQAIVVDRAGNVYLEDNKVIKALSFIGGRREEGEAFGDTIIREVKEEIGLVLSIDRFLGAELQPVREYWNERKGDFIAWKSMYYVLVLEAEELELIRESVTLQIYTISQLDNLDENKFPEKRKKEFLIQVYRALTFI